MTVGEDFWDDVQWWVDHLAARCLTPFEVPKAGEAAVTGTDASGFGTGGGPSRGTPRSRAAASPPPEGNATHESHAQEDPSAKRANAGLAQPPATSPAAEQAEECQPAEEDTAPYQVRAT